VPFAGVAPIVAGVVAKDVIEDINDVLTARIGQATTSGDYLLEKSARELKLLMSNADTILKGNIDRTFDKLTSQQQIFLRTATELTNGLNSLAESALSIEQFAAMDLNTVLGNLPGISGDTFLLKRINGYSQVYKNKGVYRIKFTGQAFKSDRRVLVSINGKPVQLLPFSTDYVATAEVPVDLINEYFSEKEVRRIPVRVQSWEKRKFLKKLVLGAEKQVLSYDSEMLLLPRMPVSYELLEVTAGTGWSQAVSTASNTALASATGKSGRWNSYLVGVEIPAGALMLTDRTKTWVAAGVPAGPWGDWTGGVQYTDYGPNGPRRAARSFAHQIHDQNRTLAIEVAYRTPVVVAGSKRVRLKDPISGVEAESRLLFDTLYEGTFSPEYSKYYLRLKYFNGEEITVDTQTANPSGIEVRPNITSTLMSVTVKIKNPYEGA